MPDDKKSKWKKKEKNGHEFDVLPTPDDHKYNCGDYTDAKLNGTSPDNCTNDDHKISVDKLKKKLENSDSGYTKKTDGSKCGTAQSKICAVMYYNKEDGEAFHWAAYDGDRGDWGGKISANGDIVRFKKPEDYLKWLSEEVRESTGMVFYCKEGEPKKISDEKLDEGTKPCTEKPKPNGKNGCMTVALLLGGGTLAVSLLLAM